MTKFLEDNPQCVIGATVWTLNRFKRNFLDKTAKKTYEFDMLFVDEASQLRVPEAAIATATTINLWVTSITRRHPEANREPRYRTQRCHDDQAETGAG